MANHIGNGGVVQADGVTIAEIKSYSYEESGEAVDNSNLASTSKTVKAGKDSWSGSIECQWDETDAAAESMTINSFIDVTFMNAGESTGEEAVDGNAMISGRSVAVTEDAITTQSFTLTGNGALTRSTQA